MSMRLKNIVLLLLALVHVVFEEELTRLGPLAAFTKGVETIRNLVAEFPPERVASITGIGADQIRLLARDFAEGIKFVGPQVSVRSNVSVALLWPS